MSGGVPQARNVLERFVMLRWHFNIRVSIQILQRRLEILSDIDLNYNNAKNE